jgi:hypothetical protein
MNTSLHDHLLRDHHRSVPDLDGLPIDALHRFEHTEHDLNLIKLDHAHSPDDVRT